MSLNEPCFDGLIVVDANSQDYDVLVNELAAQDVRVNRYARYFTGEDALRAADTSPSSVWIVNVRLPDMSGITLLSLLRRRLRQCSILLVDDAYSAEDELAARSAGATAYLCKPARATWLKDCLPRCRSHATRAGPAPRSAPPNVSLLCR
jgi:DNA-binding response OmpR family regulator